MTFRVGDRVQQPVYGTGDVVDVTRDRITISFDAGGVRKFATSLVTLEPTSVPRPLRRGSAARPRKRRPAVSSPPLAT